MFCKELPNETVEKPILERAIPVPGLTERPVSGVVDRLRFFWLHQGSVDRPKGVDLADVVHDGKQAPLYIHFQFGP